MILPPLPIDTDHWRSRWLHLNDGTEIHRVARITWENGEMIVGEGLTVCGKFGFLQMPGILSRMYADRCAACCTALNIAQGSGAPYNEDIAEP